ncbi:hypothetical protein TrLO_g5621 [Triparma laevis f. longispina]|nr:hypothetical protein TrLO_g5621 [Triparma laevis f. longispina]
MSSTGWSSEREVGGIFDSDYETLNEDSVWVNVPYCSSDGWMGNLDNQEVGFEFRGHEIVKAAIETVQERWSVGEDDTVIFGGASAGARGAMVHLDMVAEFFNDSNVYGVLDSPLWIDLDPPNYSTVGLLEQTQKVYEVSGVGEVSGKDGVITDNCASSFDGEEEYKCLFGQYRAGFLEIPHILISAEFDSFQLGQDGLNLPYPSSENEFADEFGAQMHKVFEDLIANVGDKSVTFYSQPCYNHAISMGSGYFKSATSNGVTLDAAVKAFLGGEGKSRDLTDYCEEGFDACTTSGSFCPSLGA